MRFILILILTTLCLNTSIAGDLKHISQGISDSVITTKITSKFAKDKQINPLKLSVTTKQGVVSLKGYVKNKEAFVNALQLTIATQGVKAINADELEIKQVNTAFTDAYITAKVEAAILQAKVLDDESIPLVGINASTINGVVTLSGELKNSQAIPPLLKRALAVRGVKQVISKLSVINTTPELQTATTQLAHKP